MSGGADKSEKATPKRKKDLRKKGSAARSIELPSGLPLIALVAVLPNLAVRLTQTFRTDLTLMLGSADVTDLHEVRSLTARVLTAPVRAGAPRCPAVAPPPFPLNAGELDGGSPIDEVRHGIEIIRKSYESMHAGQNFTWFIEEKIGHVLSEKMWGKVKEFFAKHLRA